MIINWLTPNHNQIQSYNSGYIAVTQGGVAGATLDQILACCQNNNALLASILTAVQARGFRRERPSRKELMEKIDLIWTEVIDIRRETRNFKEGN